MNNLFLDTFDAFLRSSLFLSIAALVVWGFLRLVRVSSPFAHRVAWGGVLLCGLLIFPMSLEIPWYDPEPVVSRPVDQAEHSVIRELPLQPDERLDT